MSTLQESDQVVQRRANLDELKKLGVDPYPHRFEADTPIAAVVRQFKDSSREQLDEAKPRFRLAGRILAIRPFGKANFVVISDGRARIQAYIRQDTLAARDFDIFRLLDLGDWVGVDGPLFRTKTNELTVHVQRLAGPLNLTTHRGEVTVDFASFTGNSVIDTHRGSIELTLPRDSRFDLRTDLGRHASVQTDFSMLTRSASGHGESMHGSVNGGGPTLDVKTYRGDIRLHSR